MGAYNGSRNASGGPPPLTGMGGGPWRGRSGVGPGVTPPVMSPVDTFKAPPQGGPSGIMSSPLAAPANSRAGIAPTGPPYGAPLGNTLPAGTPTNQIVPTSVDQSPPVTFGGPTPAPIGRNWGPASTTVPPGANPILTADLLKKYLVR